MANRKKTKNMKRNGGTTTTTRVRGAGIITQVIATGATPASSPISPGSFPRSFAISAEFQLYRFTRFHITMIPVNIAATSSDTQWWAIGYADSASSTDTMTTGRQVLECIPSGIQTNANSTALYGHHLPSGVFAIPRSDLLNQGLKWWKCVQDSDSNVYDSIQFQLIYYNPWATSQTFQIYVKYEIEFKSPINSLLTRRVFVPPARPRSSESDPRESSMRSPVIRGPNVQSELGYEVIRRPTDGSYRSF
jgi:hypothetical protein